MKKKELEEKCARLTRELAEVRAEAQICREGFAGLRDLCVAKGYMVVPRLSEYQPLRAKMEDLDEMKKEIRRRLDETYKKPKRKKRK